MTSVVFHTGLSITAVTNPAEAMSEATSPKELSQVPKPAPCMNTTPGRAPGAFLGARISTLMAWMPSLLALPCAPGSSVSSPSSVMFSVTYRSSTSYAPRTGNVRPDGLSKVTLVSSVSVAID